MRVAFKHIRASDNLGDTWCSPYDHIPELRQRFSATVHDLDEPTPQGTDAVIFGGGKISGSLADKMGPADRAAAHRIAWGVSTVQKFPIAPRYWKSFRAMDLVGSRDWGDDRFPFAPCASCMADAFDGPFEETHEAVAYLHHWRAPEMGIEVPDGMPVMDNRGDDFEAAIRFIARGRTVMSNSYHGVFWALLLGKRVVCVPFSNKFDNFRIEPTYAGPKDWQDRLADANRSDEMLGLCRDATLAFKDRVMEVLGA